MPLSPSCQGPILAAAFLKYPCSTQPAPGLPAVRGRSEGAGHDRELLIPRCDSESCHLHSYFPWHGGRGRVSWLAASSFLRPAPQLALWPPSTPLPRPHSVLTLLLALQRPPPWQVPSASGAAAGGISPSFPVPGEHWPPKPWARAPPLQNRALPCRTVSSLIYEVQAGTGPSGKQREVGAEENVRVEDVAAQIPSLPTKDWLRKEGRGIHHRGRPEARWLGGARPARGWERES